MQTPYGWRQHGNKLQRVVCRFRGIWKPERLADDERGLLHNVKKSCLYWRAKESVKMVQQEGDNIRLNFAKIDLHLGVASSALLCECMPPFPALCGLYRSMSRDSPGCAV